MEEKETLIKLLSEGASNTEIAKVLGCHRTTIPNKIKKHGIEDINRKIQIRKLECQVCGEETSSRRKRCDTCNTKIRRYRAKKYGVEYLGGKCFRCDWFGDISGFDFHHLNDKEFGLSATNMANREWELVKKELDKCELLCALCHRLEHSDYANREFILIAENDHDDLIFIK